MPRPSLHLVDPRAQRRTRLCDRVLAIVVGTAVAAAGAVPFALALGR